MLEIKKFPISCRDLGKQCEKISFRFEPDEKSADRQVFIGEIRFVRICMAELRY
jgi:hypothetical protein